MKAIQVTFDETLLEKLDQDPEVKKLGRSAVLRQAVAEYLRRRRRAEISAAYRRAYSDDGGLGSDFEGWEDDGQWPED